jgi:hypothetical protein
MYFDASALPAGGNCALSPTCVDSKRVSAIQAMKKFLPEQTLISLQPILEQAHT